MSGENKRNNPIKTVISAIARGVSYIYSPAISRHISDMRRFIYSAWLRREFRQAKGVSFMPGLQLTGARFISIGEGTGFGRNGVLQAWQERMGHSFSAEIKIGRNCWIGDCFNISAINSITIADNVLTGRYVTILDNSHGDSSIESMLQPPMQREITSKGPVVIGRDVWIGDKATILSGVTIGQGAIIAANAVVTHNVEPYTCVVGSPAKPLTKK